VKKHLKIVSTGSWHETENGKEIHRECVREPLTKKRLLKTKRVGLDLRWKLRGFFKEGGEESRVGDSLR